MTLGGWLFMIASLAFVWGLAAWCIYRSTRKRSTTPSVEAPDEPFER